MNTKNQNIKDLVKEKYSQIAEQSKLQNETSCCGFGSCCEIDYTVFSESYEHLEGYNEEADLGLGCGIPTEFVRIKAGDTVLDLGSGAGNDCFVARAIVGEKGRVIGLDFSDTMLEKARKNAAKLNFTNVEFVRGDIEEMPVTTGTVDVVVSNCVINLVPDKSKAFGEIHRILKSGGHFGISDVVLKGELPPELKESAVMYAGCVAGAIEKEEYLSIIRQSGFQDVAIKKDKEIVLPEEILKNFLSDKELDAYRNSDNGIFSITVVGTK